jgi:hypothetical protein
MPNQSGLSLEAVYSVSAASYSYATLTLTDDLPDSLQISVFINVESVREIATGAIIDIDSTFSAGVQSTIRTLDPSFITLNPSAQSVAVQDVSGLQIPGLPEYEYLDILISSTQYLAVRRSTSMSQGVVTFQPGSRLTSSQLQAANTQLLFGIQELTSELATLDSGTIGPIGPAGAEGTNGTNGTDGATGPDGADGAEGPEGPQGIQGDTGAAGQDGTGYIAQVKLPYVNVESDYLISGISMGSGDEQNLLDSNVWNFTVEGDLLNQGTGTIDITEDNAFEPDFTGRVRMTCTVVFSSSSVPQGYLVIRNNGIDVSGYEAFYKTHLDMTGTKLSSEIDIVIDVVAGDSIVPFFGVGSGSCDVHQSYTDILRLDFEAMMTDGADGADGADSTVPGPAGADGAPGTRWFSGNGTPSAGIGSTGDYYLDGTTGNVWIRTGGGWLPSGENLMGADGATSIDGLTDVDTTTVAPALDEALVWDGTNWVPGTVASGGSTTSVTLPTGSVMWTIDTSTIPAGNFADLFYSGNQPNIILTDTKPLTSSFQSGNSPTTAGFVVPSTGTYQFEFHGSVGTGSGTGQKVQSYGNWSIDGSAVGNTFYNYDESGSTTLFPMTDIVTLELTAGEVVSYRISAGSTSTTLTFRYGSMSVVQLSFDATLLGSVDLATLQAETAAATSFADYQARIAAL